MIVELNALEIETMLANPGVVNYLVQARIRAALSALLNGRVRDARILLVGADNLCTFDGKHDETDVKTLQETPAMIYFAVELARQKGTSERAEYLLSHLTSGNQHAQ